MELADIISKAWVNIHTSTTEGIGLSILEASASGTPTVAYSVPGVRDAIVNGVNGLLVPNSDRNIFASSIETIISNPKNLIRWSAKSRDAVKQFSWDKTAASWERHLMYITAKNKSFNRHRAIMDKS